MITPTGFWARLQELCETTHLFTKEDVEFIANMQQMSARVPAKAA